ncbi:MauE/DoxX family redox-associated membrane protein [Flavobacterium rhizosphaerae]|uniref:DoxX family protein n=1 Tax=Flavobacterium rhizosphaerae TaxID=3163298 RepID=A0ABW8YYH8_9FLAO
MNNNKITISWILRIIVAFMFLLSAVAKMYPSPYFAITTFEAKQLLPLGFSNGLAVFLSRILIGAELALGILMLQRNYLKRFVVPATMGLLVVFTVHLIVTIATTGNNGNCGCFGDLLPMTPLESVFKNIVLLGLLIWLYILLLKSYDKNKFWVLLAVLAVTIAGIFIVAPIKEQEDIESITPVEVEGDIITEEPLETISDETPDESTTMPAEQQPKDTVMQPVQKPTPAPVAQGPAQKTSPYSKYFADADKGKKIIALFVPGCEHCRDAAKELTELKKNNKDFPEIRIIFMNEEADLIPDFFEYAGAKYPYKIIEIATFWKVLGMSKDTPGVLYIWNGNVVKEWEGINENKFNPAELKTALKK